MKLLSTLSHALANNVVGNGNYGGNLRLFFTTLNHADWQPTPAPIEWQVGNGAAVDTYQLPSGDKIALTLNLATGAPGRLYIFGSIQVTTANSVSYGPAIGQAPAKVFTPKHPAITAFQGRSQGTQGGVQFDVGFDVTVPWDGVSADCHGEWWAVWH